MAVTLAAGTRLDHYEIVAAIGAGGMGEVYRARDERLRRDVAVSVFDVGELDGAPYLVTELLHGVTLRERLDAGPLPVRKAVELAIQLAQALAAAHDAGIVHRDLKPANLFVTRDGRLKILDFGVAKAMESVTGSQALAATLTADRTGSGAIVGTAGYMAPEQVRGKDADHRADLFAFGVVLHEMITGTAPYARDTPIERAMATLEDDPPPLAAAGREVPPALDLIVRRCLEKEREDRFQSARDLAFALKASLSATGDAVHERTNFMQWSADGQSLYASTWEDSGSVRGSGRAATVVEVDLRTGRVTPWLDLPLIDATHNERLYDVLITRDGKGYVYGYQRFSGELYLVKGLR